MSKLNKAEINLNHHSAPGLSRFGQIAWIAVIVVALVLLVQALPASYERYRVPCASEPCVLGQLRPTDLPALERLGWTIDTYAAVQVGLAMASMLVFVGAGTAIFALRRSELMPLLVSAILVCIGVANFAGDFGSFPARIIGFIGWGSMIVMLFLFPSGQFVPKWSRWASAVFVASELIYYFAPRQSSDDFSLASVIGSVAWLGSWVLGLGAQVYRYRRVATTIERQQTKWVVFGLGLVVATSLSLAILIWRIPDLTIAGFAADTVLLPIFTNVIFTIIPITIGLAVLRRGLWAVDPLINRTLVYATLTSVVALLYILVVSYLGLLFRANGSLAVSIVATVLVAALFQPIRVRVQRLVNRLLYGERDDPNAVLARLGARLEATLAPEAVLPTIVETLAQALKLPYAAVALDDATVVAYPPETSRPSDVELLQLPLVYQGQSVGALLVAPRAAGEAWSPADRRLLEATADHAGVAVHGVRLMGDLRRVNAELQRSREGLVLAREEERRRLRADLHDDLAPTLAALAMSAGKASRLVTKNPEAAVQQMDELRTALRARVGDIRRLAYNLRPLVLDELGLVGAVRERAAHYSESGEGPFVQLEVSNLPALPAAVEVAAYRIVQEALANVAKHGGAHHCTVRISVDEECLELQIADDGVGMSENAKPGIGVRSMQDRAHELGGSFRIGPRHNGGTVLVARLPIMPFTDGETC